MGRGEDDREGEAELLRFPSGHARRAGRWKWSRQNARGRGSAEAQGLDQADGEGGART